MADPEFSADNPFAAALSPEERLAAIRRRQAELQAEMEASRADDAEFFEGQVQRGAMSPERAAQFSPDNPFAASLQLGPGSRVVDSINEPINPAMVEAAAQPVNPSLVESLANPISERTLARFATGQEPTGDPIGGDEARRQRLADLEGYFGGMKGAMADTARAFAQGATLGTSDEIMAAAEATYGSLTDAPDSWKQRYDEALAGEREELATLYEEQPGFAMGMEAVGGLATALPTMGASMGPAAARVGYSAATGAPRALARRSFTKRLLGGTAAGAGYGGAYGFGAGEGGVTPRLEGAMTPAALGGGVGAVTPLAGAITRPAASYLAKRRVAERLGEGITRPGQGTGRGARRRAALRAVDPVQAALQTETRDAAATLAQPQPGSLMGEQFGSTRAALSEELKALDKAKFADPEIGLINRRADDAAGKVEGAIDDALGETEGIEALMTRLREESAPQVKEAYDSAYSAVIDYASDEGIALEAALKRAPPSAVRDAKRLMDLDGLESQQFFASIRDDGSIAVTRMPNVREVDYITRALNDMAKAERGKVGPGQTTTTAGGKLEAVSSEVRSQLKRLVPQYAEALERAAPPLVARESTELGINAMKTGMTNDKFKAEIANLKKRHPRLAGLIDKHIALGMRNQIEDVVQRAKDPLASTPTQTGYVARGAQRDPTTDRTLKDLSSGVNRSKIETAIGNERASKLFSELDKGGDAIELRDTLVINLREAARKASDEERIGPSSETMYGAMREAVREFKRRRRGARPDPTSESIVNVLMKKADQEEMTDVLRLGPKRSRGLGAAQAAEVLVGAPSLAATTAVSRRRERRNTADQRAREWMQGAAEHLTGLAGVR